MQAWIALFLSVSWLAGLAAPAAADQRVALVVGNSAYRNIARLDNPANDAKLMADTLRGLGFTLIGGAAQIDLDKPGIDRAVQAFGAQLRGAEVALFYYAGHGVQVRGANYLVPVDANPVSEADVDFQMLDTNLVLRQMEVAGTKLNLVILDACRNNPFGGRGLRATAGGLAQMQAPEGTLISYATQPGAVAGDGTDGNSPYTKALTQTIRKAGLGIFDAFNEVGLAVKQVTGGAQQPWLSSSPIAGSFYFTTPPAAPSSVNSSAINEAALVWAKIKDAANPAVFDAFIRRFGDGFYADLARARLDELKAAAAKAPPQVAVVAQPAPLGASAPSVQQAAVAPPTPTGSRCGGSPAVGVSLSSRAAKPLSAGEECALRPKDVFKECATCPEMVVVPAGSFTMGSPDSEPERSKSEGPQHSVTLAKPFVVGRFAVTFDEWDACVAGGGCNGYRPSDLGWGRGRQPVINVSWDNAKAYLAWLSKTTGKIYRLLSEAEREYVTRAGTTTPFWWGSSISPQQANYTGTSTYNNGAKGEWRQKTVRVDSFAANPFGLYQVQGNVWDWVEDCEHGSYDGAPLDGSAWTAGDCKLRILRGGSWDSDPRFLRSAFRGRITSGNRYGNLGFRVARTLLTP